MNAIQLIFRFGKLFKCVFVFFKNVFWSVHHSHQHEMHQSEEQIPFSFPEKVKVKLKLLDPNNFKFYRKMICNCIKNLDGIDWKFKEKIIYIDDGEHTIADVKSVLVKEHYNVIDKQYFVVYEWQRSNFVPLHKNVKLASISRDDDNDLSLRYNILYFPPLFNALN